MSPLEKKLKEIGARFSRIRLEKNLTVDQIAKHTMISKRVIVAIEKGNLQDLPEPFYIKALIAKYAKAIGTVANWDYEKLDHEETSIASQKSPKVKVHSQQGKSSRSRRSSHISLDAKTKHNQPRESKGFQLKPAHLYLLYLTLVVVAIRSIASLVEEPVVVNNQAVPEQNISLSNQETPLNGNVPTTISSASPSQFVSQSSSNNSESVVVDIDLKERCWLKVVVDGKVKFEGTLAKGSKRSWQGKEQINIIAGNAGGVVVTYNQGKEKILGKPGQVQEVTYTVN